MRILYGYSNCTDETYNRIMSERNASAMQPDQKYHSLVIRGLAENGAEVRCFSGLPVNRAVTARKLVREQDEQQGSAHFHYITTINYPGIRHLMIFFGTLFGVLRSKKDKETYAVCDFLNTATAFPFNGFWARKLPSLLALSPNSPKVMPPRLSMYAVFSGNLRSEFSRYSSTFFAIASSG